ncbi:MAG: hypothetical protein VXX85_07770 [Candidatus Margulisiibacteriota bacterium]|nr:hypothetical protein [Candidatus Margulisiibacteriota bacterium]
MITLYKIMAVSKPETIFSPIVNSPTEGSCDGTYFIDDSFIIKISEDPKLDILSYKVATLLGIPTPEMDIMTFSQFKCKNGYDLMLDKISDKQRISIQAKIPAPSLSQIISNKKTGQHEAQLKNWHQLGQILGFDLILDNEDRFNFTLEPFCGTSNFGNILVGDSLIAIDLTPTKINKFADYYNNKIYKLCEIFKSMKLEFSKKSGQTNKTDELTRAYQLNKCILNFIDTLPISVSKEEKEAAANIIKQSIFDTLKNFINKFGVMPINKSNHYQYLTQLHRALSITDQTNTLPNRPESPVSIAYFEELFFDDFDY